MKQNDSPRLITRLKFYTETAQALADQQAQLAMRDSCDNWGTALEKELINHAKSGKTEYCRNCEKRPPQEVIEFVEAYFQELGAKGVDSADGKFHFQFSW